MLNVSIFVMKFNIDGIVYDLNYELLKILIWFYIWL